MNQLPSVIQKEIWEYVRGNRGFHRQLFGQVVDHFNEIIEQTEIDLYSIGMPWKKPNRLKFYSSTTQFRRNWNVNQFLKYQHSKKEDGMLFADSSEEFREKARQWVEWFDQENPEFITNLIRQYHIHDVD